MVGFIAHAWKNNRHWCIAAADIALWPIVDSWQPWLSQRASFFPCRRYHSAADVAGARPTRPWVVRPAVCTGSRPVARRLARIRDRGAAPRLDRALADRALWPGAASRSPFSAAGLCRMGRAVIILSRPDAESPTRLREPSPRAFGRPTHLAVRAVLDRRAAGGRSSCPRVLLNPMAT